MPLVETACPLDCPDSCSLEVMVERGRVTELRGSRRNPLTQGFICSKVRRFPERIYGSARLQQPGLKTGSKGDGQFRPLSWSEALERLVGELERVKSQHGGEAILPLAYGGSNGLLTDRAADQLFFDALGASRLARTVCAAPSTRAASGLYGKMAGVSPTDYTHARLIVVWGANPSVSGIHFVPSILKAKRQGARLVVIDPRRTSLARAADLHLGLRPGADLPVALSVIHWLFESGNADLEFLETRTTGWEELRSRASAWTFRKAAQVAEVSPRKLAELARIYADSSPAVIRCGWGLERNRNGGSAVAAVLALPAVAGKFGVRGGGYTMSNSGVWDLSAAEALDTKSPGTRIINMNQVGRRLQESTPPIKLLFVYNCNPLMTLPDQERVRQGLIRQDLFTVVFDQVFTDTARYADLILPATTFLEHHDLARGYGAMLLHEVRPAISPRGQARSNPDVFNELCRRMELIKPSRHLKPPQLARKIIAGSSRAAELERSLRTRGVAFPATGFEPVQFVDAFPQTADGKVHLLPGELDQEAPAGLYGYRPDPASQEFPLALISPATNRTISSSLGELHRRQVPLEMHPRDARKRGIRSGDRVKVFNQLGEVHCRVKLSLDLPAGTVLLPKGLWSHNTLNGRTANALTPDSLGDLGAGACFNDARVEVSPAR